MIGFSSIWHLRPSYTFVAFPVNRIGSSQLITQLFLFAWSVIADLRDTVDDFISLLMMGKASGWVDLTLPVSFAFCSRRSP